MPNKKTTEEFIKDATNVHGDKYNYSNVVYDGNKAKITIICQKHGEFLQTPHMHLQGNGCAKCSKVHKPSTDEWIIMAKNTHGNKYDYSKVVYVDNSKKVTIICNKHGEFQQIPSNHLQGNNCPKCSGSYRPTTKEWIKNAITIHGNKYDYTKVNYENSKTKITIICRKHGEFQQTPNSHLVGQGCVKCGIESRTLVRKKPQEQFIEEAKKIHGNKYDYSLVVYKNSSSKIIIICNDHGQFQQTPYAHLTGRGCIRCNVASKKNKIFERFVDVAISIHGNKYDYSHVDYNNSKNKVQITCKTHGDFQQSPSSHLSGYGCQKCNNCPACCLWRTGGKLCQYCEPATKNKLYYKTKEMDVVKFLKEQLPDNDFIHNRSVGTECTGGHFFPDIRFDCIWFQLIVEVDEHKHRGSGYQCDEKRMYDIAAKIGQPCIFIRYNPDSKNSCKNMLLDNVKYYLDLQDDYVENYDINIYEKLEITGLLGFKALYLFY